MSELSSTNNLEETGELSFKQGFEQYLNKNKDTLLSLVSSALKYQIEKSLLYDLGEIIIDEAGTLYEQILEMTKETIVSSDKDGILDDVLNSGLLDFGLIEMNSEYYQS